MNAKLTPTEKKILDNSYKFWSSPSENLETYSSPIMNDGERRILYVTATRFIIIEKIPGTVLKHILGLNGVIQKLIQERKYNFMFINRQKHPMFLNTSNNMMYFSDCPHNVWYTGHYESAIMDTNAYCNSPEDIRNNYYMIAYVGGNVYDGTIQYIATDDLLREEERLVRIETKKIILAIVEMYANAYVNRPLKKPSKNEIDDVLNDLLILIVFLAISTFMLFLLLIFS